MYAIAVDACIRSIERRELPLCLAISCFALIPLSKEEITSLHRCVVSLWKVVDDGVRAAIFDYYIQFILPDDDYSINVFALKLFFCLNYHSFLPFISDLVHADECILSRFSSFVVVISAILKEADYFRVPDQAMLILLKLSLYYPSVHEYLWNSFHSGRFTPYNCHFIAQTIALEKAHDLAGCCVELLSATDVENEWVWLRLYHGTTLRRTIYVVLFKAFGRKLMDACKCLCESGHLCWSLIECFLFCWIQSGLNSVQYLESIKMNTLPVVLKCVIGSLNEQECLMFLHSPKLFPSAVNDYALMLLLKCSRVDIYLNLVRSMARMDNQDQTRMYLAMSRYLSMISFPSWVNLDNSRLDYYKLEKHFLPLTNNSRPVEFVLSIDCLTLSLIFHNQLYQHNYSDLLPTDNQPRMIDPLDMKCLLDVAIACSTIRYMPDESIGAVSVCVDLLSHLFHSPKLMSFVEGISLDIGIKLFEHCRN